MNLVTLIPLWLCLSYAALLAATGKLMPKRMTDLLAFLAWLRGL